MSKLSGWKVVCLAVAGVALSLLATNGVRADSFSDQAAKLDIVGVHLGMSPDEAKSVLNQHRKDMGKNWLESSGHAEARVGSDANGGGEAITVIFSPPPGDPKLVAVWRDLSFDESHAPTVEGLVSSLTDKFGQPSRKSQDPSYQILDWSWDKAGQLSKRKCDVDDANLDKMGFLSLNFIPDLQRENDGGCAMAAQAVIYRTTLGTAGRLTMTLIDPHDALPAAIAADNHAKQVEQAKKEEELKKASANKPAL